jgi:hypothetical protein
MIGILAYWVRRCGLNNCNSTGDIDETCFKLTNEEDREEVRFHVDTIEDYEDS